MSFYVRRTNEDGREGWVGPIRSEAQADREVAAWRECGWSADRVPVTTESRAEVKAWMAAVKAAR